MLSCAWLVIVAWLIWRAFRQSGLLRPLPVAPPPAPTAPSVTIVIPVRDEAGNIGPCLRCALEQDYPAAQLKVVVVDDHSCDATMALAAQAARADPRVTLMRSPPLPPRWIGKSHACWIGATSPPTSADWLCFIDADVRMTRGLLSSAVTEARRSDIDLLSLAPRQTLGSFAERLVIPCGFFILGVCQDLCTIQNAGSGEATATGQFMLIRADRYRAIGGHAAVASAICEDTALARLLKRNGARVMLQAGHDLLSARMYTGWRSLWCGFSKNLTDTFGGPARTLAIAVAAAAFGWLAWLLPLWIAATWLHEATLADAVALAAVLAASGAVLAFHVAGAVFFRIPLWYGVLFPIGYSAGALIALDSVRRRLHGRVQWKGRTYP
jgi:chlorobactene glucosyltransferase